MLLQLPNKLVETLCSHENVCVIWKDYNFFKFLYHKIYKYYIHNEKR